MTEDNTTSLKIGDKRPRLIGKREANRIDKEQRIRRAAQELFSVNGYDETTMREIAQRADVALGTLFLYVSNKRDLLFLIANDILDSLVDSAEEFIEQEDRDLVVSFLTVCVIHFRAFSLQPALFRLVMRELLFYDSGEQAQRAIRNRSKMMELFKRIVMSAEKRGEIELARDADHMAWILFSIQGAEVRRWLAQDKFDLTEGINRLWSTATLIFNGFAVTKMPEKPRRKDSQLLLQRAMAAATNIRS